MMACSADRKSWVPSRVCREADNNKRSLAQGRQGRGGDALADAFEVLVWRVELDVLVLWELRLDDLLRLIQHNLAANPGAHAAHDHEVVDHVVFAIQRDGVTQIDAHRLINLPGLRLLCGVLHRRLDELEALRVRLVLHDVHVGVPRLHLVGEVHPPRRGELRCATLPQVHVRDPAVRVPRVRLRLRIQIARDVAQLVNPTHEVAVLVRVTAALAAAHGNAHDVASAKLHDRGQGCNLAVVDDPKGRVAELLREALEDVDDLRPVHVGRDVGEDVAPRGLVV
mmetsp:Transcript_82884/g.231157  ORF Transcript_82884/g.231157 Transcript_82884/m.231157 type:complete len:282 (-) Transcript_82884:812-1657(-)